jgi:hypothetical protein
MKKLFRNLFPFMLLVAFAVSNFGCSAMQTIANLERLQFKLGKVHDFRVAGVNISNISSINNLNLLDAAKLATSFAEGKLPVGFTLDVLARNPNTPGGSANSTSAITRLDWRLLIDSKDILDGVVDSEIIVPGTGQEAVIPINMAFDMMPFFQNMGYEGIVNLAMAIGGKNGSSSRLTVKGTPSMKIFGIMIPSPEITIVDTQFN